MAEIVISIAAKVSEYLVDPIGRQISYAFKYQRNIEELKEQVKKLTNRRESVQNDVNEAKRQGEEIQKEVQDWLDSVDDFVKKTVKPIIDDEVKLLKLTHEKESVQHSVDKAKIQGDEIEKQVREWLNSAVVKPITDDSVKAKKLCSRGLCPNPMTRYSLSKKAAKARKDGVDLLGEGKFPKVSYRHPPQRTNSLIIKGYEDFASRNSLSESIMKALADADTNLIGVYGMGGVGKTTLVKKVAQQAKENKLFDVVVTAVVTETPDIRKIQGQIADELGLIFQEETEPGRAARLRERMKKENRILVILDNVWAKLDLESIGIPEGGDEKGSITQKVHQKEEENANKWQCKILLTSRRLDVLRDDMDIQKNFKVEVLSDPEAESLFWTTVGCLEEKSDLNPIAVEIVGKCGGLPVAIKTIANALKNKSLPSWKTARDQLKKANPKNIKGMNEDVYSTIELSFNFLEGEEAKSLFLLCSLCNGGYGVNITDMLKYSMGLDLFQDVDTIEEGRNKLHSLIDALKTSCLLMDHDYGSNYVKMHDVIHVVAVSIASTTKLWFNLRDAAGLKEELEKKLPKDSAAVTLLFRDIYELPEKIEFPKLELCLLYMEDASLQIPDALFEGMKGLKVLEMSGIHLLSPPSSLRCLINLHTLCLDRCRLEDVAIIGELKELEVLSFLNSDIEWLPREIGQLARLRFLDLSHCSKLKVIKPNVISSLTCLEELYMGHSFDQWDIEGQSNASLAELKQLSCLIALDIHIPNDQIIPEDLSFEKLERYRIFIGKVRVWDWYDKYETSRTMKLKFSSSIYLSNEINRLLNRTEDVFLDKLKGVKSVVYELSREGFPQLKHLHVQNGSDIQYIANSFRWGLGNVFPQLESLFLDNLINLEKICHAQLAPKSFSKLRIVKVRKCDRLKHLFSFSMVNNLLQLQEIKVTDCMKLEEIVSKESVEQNESIRRIEFTQLHTLTLECLPQLTSFIFNASTPDIGSQEIVAEVEADGFMSLFSQNVVLPSLKNLKLSSINIRCTWLDQLPVISSCCRVLTNLTLEECNDLKFLFSYSVVQSLVQLQKLEVRNCKSIEEIINAEELRGEKKMIMMVFPKLLNLQLKGLSKLARFGSGNLVEFLSLTQISIVDCPNLKTFFSSPKYADIKQSKEIEEMNCQDDIYPLFDEKVMLPTLASINLSSIRIQTIWHNQLQPMSPCFQNLKEIIMDGCDTVKYGLPSSMVESLVQLQVLEISNCKLMEVVAITAGERMNNTLFTKLHRLHLKHLPELTTFCNFAGKLIELTSLAELWLENCPKMHAFVSNSPHADMPAANEEQINSEKILHSHVQPFFDEKVVLPSLKNLKLSSINIRCTRLDQLPVISSCCRALTNLTLEECNGLKFLFSYSVVQSLVQLQKLEVRNCKSIEEIINTEELRGEKKMIKMVFPKLLNLLLKGLPKLSQFGSGNSIEFLSLTQISIEDCPKLKTFFFGSKYADKKESKEVEEMNLQEDIHLLFDEKVELPTLASLKLSSIASQTIWHNQLQALSACFHNLTKLTIYGCHNLKYLFPISVAKSLNHLEDLYISDCKLMERVVMAQDERKISTLFPKLKGLNLFHLLELIRFCNFNGNSIELPSLSELNIYDCPKMQTFASDSLPSIEEPEEVNTETEDNLPSFFDEKVSFPCLKKLELSDLPELLNLLKKNSQPRKVFENLAYLEVSGCSNLKTVSLQNLETLEVRNCDGLISLVTFSTAKSLEQLKRMEIIDCKLIEEIIVYTGDEIKDGIVFSQLEYLKLDCLPSLTSFCKGNFTIEFPYLQRVLVIGCLKMMNFSQGLLSTPKLHSLQLTESSDEWKWECKGFWEGEEDEEDDEEDEEDDEEDEEGEGCWEGDLNTTIQKLFRDEVGLRYIENFTVSDFPHLKEVWHEKFLVSYFSNLKSLVVDDKCCRLRYIFTPSVALGLAQLQDLEIKNCVVLEVITVIGEETISNTMFPNLNSLELMDLPNLTCFSNFAGNSIELPSLKHLSIENCPNMETFISNFLGVDMSTSKENCHTDIQPLFDEKVGLPNLKFLELDTMDKLRKIWHHQLSSDSFCKLEYFGVHNCHNVLNVIPSNMLGRLQKLHELLLINCSSLCEIFELQASGCGKTQAITATQLEKLVLHDLPKLKHIWDVDSQGLLTCQNLISIEVTGCGSLKSIFPASVGRNLLRLEELCIVNCCMVEEIFANEEQVDEAVPRFPQLTLLRLAELSRLRSFYPRVHISEWPMLKELQVWNCDKVYVSASKFLSFQVTHEMPLDQPLLLLDKVPLTNLESLGLDWKWLEKEALHEILPEHSCNLNFLAIKGFHKGADICVFCFLRKLPNLETLQVSGGFFKEVFLCEGFGCEEKHVEAPSKLSHLMLVELNDSLYLWEENSLSSKGFQNLAILEVVCCSNIKSLVSSSVSFQNLTILEVLECNELLNLVAVPTAKSLVQLTELSISECKMVEEIIIHEGDEVKDRIIFKKLRNLELKCLPSLTSFYPGSYTIVFPSLQQVVVSECPNMKIFSRGVLSTPRLHRLQTTEEDKGFWKGNLNTTIEHLFIESSKEN